MSPSEDDDGQAGVDSGSASGSSSDLAESQSVPADGAAEFEPSEAEPAEAAPSATPPASSVPPRATAAGRVWVGLIVGVVLVVLLIIFIAENSGAVTISFLGAKGKISLGLAMLAAAVVGAVVTLLVGTTRILQLRREVRRQVRHA